MLEVIKVPFPLGKRCFDRLDNAEFEKILMACREEMANVFVPLGQEPTVKYKVSASLRVRSRNWAMKVP